MNCLFTEKYRGLRRSTNQWAGGGLPEEQQARCGCHPGRGSEERGLTQVAWHQNRPSPKNWTALTTLKPFSQRDRVECSSWGDSWYKLIWIDFVRLCCSTLCLLMYNFIKRNKQQSNLLWVFTFDQWHWFWQNTKLWPWQCAKLCIVRSDPSEWLPTSHCIQHYMCINYVTCSIKQHLLLPPVNTRVTNQPGLKSRRQSWDCHFRANYYL